MRRSLILSRVLANYGGYYIYRVSPHLCRTSECVDKIPVFHSLPHDHQRRDLFRRLNTVHLPGQLKLAQISSGQGAIFMFIGPSSGPGWIVGDTFLKNVYSVFRVNPASAGVAVLAAGAQSSVTQKGVQTATVGSTGESFTGSGYNRNAASPSVGGCAEVYCMYRIVKVLGGWCVLPPRTHAPLIQATH
jgi:hypothetical protein